MRRAFWFSAVCVGCGNRGVREQWFDGKSAHRYDPYANLLRERVE